MEKIEVNDMNENVLVIDVNTKQFQTVNQVQVTAPPGTTKVTLVTADGQAITEV